MLGGLGQFRYGLNGCRAGADDADNLVVQLVHRFVGAAAGDSIIPPRGMERVTLEVVDTGDCRQLRHVQYATADHDEAGVDQIVP